MANILGYGYVTVKDDGEQNPLKQLFLKNGATWAEVQIAYIKSGTQWIRVFPTPNAVINLNVSSLTFDTYTTFRSKVETITITNTGDEVLTINSTTSSTSSKFEIITDYSALGASLPYRINPGATKSFTAQILGKDVGSDTGSIVLQTNKGALGDETITIALSCETIPLFSKALADVTSLSLRHDQNGPTTVATVRIYNNGNGPLTISSFAGVSSRISVINDTQGISNSLFLTVDPGTFRSYRVSVAESFKTSYGANSDTLRIVSDSVDGTINIPVNLLVVPHGSITFTTDGTWQVPIGLLNDVELEIQGAEGAAGGNDSAAGGAGGDGAFYKISATIPYPQVLQVAIGGRGSVGATTPGAGGSPGGAGGTNSFGFGNGGAGGRAGTSGWSGGGGGGGAATIVGIKNSLLSPPSTYIFGGGGGGGGGGGNRSLGLAGNTGIGEGGFLVAVSLDGRWSSFMNNNAVMPKHYQLNTAYNIYRTFTAPYTGNYYFNFSGDNYAAVYVNGSLVGETSSFTSTSSVVRSLPAGDHVIRVVVSDWGVAAGVACTITNNTNTTTLFNLRNLLTTQVAVGTSVNGDTGQVKSGDGGGGGGGGGGYPGGLRGPNRGGDTGAYGGYRGANGIQGPLTYTVLDDKTRAGAPYVKITW